MAVAPIGDMGPFILLVFFYILFLNAAMVVTSGSGTTLVPLVLVGGLFVLFLVIAVFVAISRFERGQEPAEREQQPKIPVSKEQQPAVVAVDAGKPTKEVLPPPFLGPRPLRANIDGLGQTHPELPSSNQPTERDETARG